MTRDAEIVLAGFAKLSEAEQREVAEAIANHEREGYISRKSIDAGWEKRGKDRILMGPVASGCPCCGR